MRKLLRFFNFIVALVLLIIFTGRTSAEDNKVVNPSFETGNISGWGVWAVTSHVSNKENYTLNGQYSATPSLNVKDGPFEAGALIQEFTDFVPGNKIYAGAWIKTDRLKGTDNTNAYALIKIEFWDDGDMISAKESTKFTGTQDWTQVNATARIPTQTKTVKLLLMLYNQGGRGNLGQAYFDDVYLSAVPLLY